MPEFPDTAIDMMRSALQLARLGLPMHWLRGPALGGKAPIGEDWQHRPWTSPALLQARYRAGMNLGLRTGQVRGALYCLVVLDLDGPGALDWARGTLPETPLRVLTARGEHWYFLHPGPSVRIGNRAHVDGRPLDVRADGGQVVVPPSVHPSGHRYRWALEPSQALLLTVPTWDPSWVPAPPAAPAAPAAALAPLDWTMRRRLARARGAAQKWRVAEEGEGRGTQTYKLAIMLVKGLQLDEESAYQVLASEWNPRLAQPYAEPLLRRKVAEAMKAQRATGALIDG